MVLTASPVQIDTPGDLEDTKGDSPVSEEEKKEVKAVLNLFNKWKKARSSYDRKWMDYYKLFRGVQWSSRRPSYRHSEIINMVFSTIQSNMPLQLDARPRFQFLPQEPQDRDFAEILNQLSEFDWEKHNWMHTLSEVVLDGYLYGTAFSSMEYDPDLDFGIGSAVYQSEDPFYCYPDPESNDINDPKSQGFFFAKPIETARLKAMFPDKADDIKADVNDFIKSSKTDINNYYNERDNTDLEMPEFISDHGSEEAAGIERTFLIKAYLKPLDVSQVEKEVESEDGEEAKIEFEIHKKYPKGRMVWIANGRLLKNEDLPYDDMKIPFQKYNNYILSREFWGISEVEQLESPQKVFNKILSFTLDAMTLMGNPVWIVDTGSGVATENLTGAPGLIVEKEPGTEVRREQGPSVNPSFLNVLNQLETWFNNVSGTQDVSRGQTPGSVTAASAIEQLQQAAKTRIRQKMRNLDGYLRQVGDQWQARVFQFYSVPKIVRITGKDDVNKFFKLSIEKDEEGQRVATVQEFHEPNDEGEGNLVPGTEKKLIVKGFFDTKTMTGSALPFAIADRENKALGLFDRGILDAEEVLNIVDFPNKEKILLRLKERQEAEAEAAAQGPQQ